MAYILTSLGYDISITIGRAKAFDMTALTISGKTINIQVKSTYGYSDWLISHELNSGPNSILALVQLKRSEGQKPELYFLPGAQANKLITHKYITHSPQLIVLLLKRNSKITI